MNTPEQNLWKRIARNMPGVHFERFEDMTKSGVPDVQAVVAGRVTWIELKAVRNYPTRPFTPVLGRKGLSRGQMNWHLTHRANGGNVCTLVGVGSYDYFLISGEHSDALNKWSRFELQRGAQFFGTGPAFWPKLQNFLEGKLA